MIRENFFHRLEDAFLSQLGEADLAGRRIENSREQGFLQLERFPNSLFNAVLRQQMHHVDRMGLAEAMDSSDPLFEPGGIPWRLKIDDRRCCLEIQANASRIRRKENTALRIAPEFLYERAAIP